MQNYAVIFNPHVNFIKAKNSNRKEWVRDPRRRSVVEHRVHQERHV